MGQECTADMTIP